jgi:uncharacterized MnhB-related membrane protein
MLDQRGDFHDQMLTSAITPANLAIRGPLHGVDPRAFLSLVMEQAQTLAFADVAYGVALLAALLVPLVFLLQRPRGPIEGVSFE